MNRKSEYIAVFDSGVGGLSVLRHLRALMPGERFLYYGDSKNAPYGGKTRTQIRELTLQAAEKLVSRGVKALVIACNTATAAAIAEVRKAWPELIVVGIEPAVKLAADRCPGGTIGVLATSATLHLEKFSQLTEQLQLQGRVVKLEAPGLVELVEAGLGESEQSRALLEPILAPWAGKLDALVLGCTHYPFAARTIAACLPGTQLLDGGEGTARETLRRLRQRDLLEQGTGELCLENSLDTPKILELSANLLEKQPF